MCKKITLLFLGLWVMITTACSQDQLLVVQGQTMGTFYSVKVSCADTEQNRERIQMAVNTALTKVNSKLNTYDPASEISCFNAYNEPGAYPLSEEFMRVSRVAEQIYKTSGGAFDPTVKDLVSLWGFGDEGVYKRPAQTEIDKALQHVGLDKIRLIQNGIIKNDPDVHLDYSGIAKGYGVDLVMDEITLLGYKDVLVDIGGEVKARGKKWRIGIAVPDVRNISNQQTIDVISLKDIACATSGDYQQFYEENGERYTHLIDPKTGYPIKHDVTSVTVIAQDCMLADAAATAAIVLGKEKGVDFIESLEGVEAFFIYRDNDMLRSVQTKGWKRSVK